VAWVVGSTPPAPYIGIDAWPGGLQGESIPFDEKHGAFMGFKYGKSHGKSPINGGFELEKTSKPLQMVGRDMHIFTYFFCKMGTQSRHEDLLFPV